MKLKKELFRRNTRMTHRFGPNDSPDPFDSTSFDPHVPISPTRRSSPSLTIQKQGEYRYCDPQSPVVTPGGRVTSTNGPSPDKSDPIAQTIPQNTVKRKVP